MRRSKVIAALLLISYNNTLTSTCVKSYPFVFFNETHKLPTKMCATLSSLLPELGKDIFNNNTHDSHWWWFVSMGICSFRPYKMKRWKFNDSYGGSWAVTGVNTEKLQQNKQAISMRVKENDAAGKEHTDSSTTACMMKWKINILLKHSSIRNCLYCFLKENKHWLKTPQTSWSYLL